MVEFTVATSAFDEGVEEWDFFVKFVELLKGSSRYIPVWPKLEIGWRSIVGTLIAFFGAAFGSAGGVGAGGIFVPMLTLVIGFDAKSSTAISKCMIMGLSAATVVFNIRKRHPTIDLPPIDYELALVVQPMLLLGISTGVILNVVFANWMVTILLIVAFLGTSTRSFFKGVEMWKKETIAKKEVPKQVKSGEIEYTVLPGGPREQPKVSLAQNVNWKQLCILTVVAFVSGYTNCQAVYLVLIAIAASLTGQHVVKKWIDRVGRASLIVFILSSIIFTSAILLGGQGIVNMVYKITHNEYMGFEDLCESASIKASLARLLD